MSSKPAYLMHVATGEMHEAEIYNYISDAHLDLWENEWRPVMNGYTAGKPHPRTPEDAYWDWVKKANLYKTIIAINSYSLICNSHLQGLMMTDDTQAARLPEQFGKPLVYIKFLATSPGNRPEITSIPNYRGVGGVSF